MASGIAAIGDPVEGHVAPSSANSTGDGVRQMARISKGLVRRCTRAGRASPTLRLPLIIRKGNAFRPSSQRTPGFTLHRRSRPAGATRLTPSNPDSPLVAVRRARHVAWRTTRGDGRHVVWRAPIRLQRVAVLLGSALEVSKRMASWSVGLPTWLLRPGQL